MSQAQPRHKDAMTQPQEPSPLIVVGMHALHVPVLTRRRQHATAASIPASCYTTAARQLPMLRMLLTGCWRGCKMRLRSWC